MNDTTEAKPTDEKLADDVREAVAVLNDKLSAAGDAGLTVELEFIDVTQIDDPAPRRHVTPEIFRLSKTTF